MKVYIAGSWKRKGDAAILADHLEANGFKVVRRWWMHDADEHEILQQLADGDYAGVVNCDAFVVCNWPKSEGKAVETGIALHRHRSSTSGFPGLFILDDNDKSEGNPTNIFQNLDDFEWTFSTEELIDALRDFAKRTGR